MLLIILCVITSVNHWQDVYAYRFHNRYKVNHHIIFPSFAISGLIPLLLIVHNNVGYNMKMIIILKVYQPSFLTLQRLCSSFILPNLNIVTKKYHRCRLLNLKSKKEAYMTINILTFDKIDLKLFFISWHFIISLHFNSFF